MQAVKSPFVIENEEWYTYDKSPRPNVHVLASVDEKTYTPSTDIKMGDHPVIWTNEHYKARNIYIFMGQPPGCFRIPAFTQHIQERNLLGRRQIARNHMVGKSCEEKTVSKLLSRCLFASWARVSLARLRPHGLRRTNRYSKYWHSIPRPLSRIMSTLPTTL